MSNETTSILVVGVGGQGTILASRVLTVALLRAGYDVKMAEVHGMAQRGGSVVTHVRFGSRIFSPLTPKGTADFLLAFEKLEALRWLDYLKPGGTVLVNNLELPPLSVLTDQAVYPEDIFKKLEERAGRVTVIPAQELAQASGSIRSQNIVLLGVLARHLGIAFQEWETVIRENVPPHTVEANLAAFRAGLEV